MRASPGRARCLHAGGGPSAACWPRPFQGSDRRPPGLRWEKGQVENQVGVIRQRLFTPRLRFKSYDELNAWLLDQCVVWAKAQPHPEVRDRTIWEMFEAERSSLIPYAGSFDGFHAVPAIVSKTCLVRFDTNKYSVRASAVGRPVEIRAP